MALPHPGASAEPPEETGSRGSIRRWEHNVLGTVAGTARAAGHSGEGGPWRDHAPPLDAPPSPSAELPGQSLPRVPICPRWRWGWCWCPAAGPRNWGSICQVGSHRLRWCCPHNGFCVQNSLPHWRCRSHTAAVQHSAQGGCSLNLVRLDA